MGGRGEAVGRHGGGGVVELDFRFVGFLVLVLESLHLILDADVEGGHQKTTLAPLLGGLLGLQAAVQVMHAFWLG